MNSLYIPKTSTTPEIDYKNDGRCKISGSSRPEDLDGLYSVAKRYLSGLVSLGIPIEYTFNFDYFNTLSQRYIYEIFEILSKARLKNNEVTWCYLDIDEDVQEMGEFYQEIFKDLNIKLKKIKS